MWKNPLMSVYVLESPDDISAKDITSPFWSTTLEVTRLLKVTNIEMIVGKIMDNILWVFSLIYQRFLPKYPDVFVP